jgi:hypothetical protein
LRMYEIEIGFTWSTTDSDHCGTWLCGVKRTDIGPDRSRSL